MSTHNLCGEVVLTSTYNLFFLFFFSRNVKNIRFFFLYFLVVKFSVYLNRLVFVMGIR